MSQRSPRYPRISLWKSLDLVQKLFDGAHRSKIDVDAAARIMGYSSSSGGAAASAIGALRQFGLVEGQRGEVRVSELAMTILQPLNSVEKYQGVKEAAGRPDSFARILDQFGGVLPGSNEAVRAFLIRNEGFSVSGANDLISALRDTFDGLPDSKITLPQEGEAESAGDDLASLPSQSEADNHPQSASLDSPPPANVHVILLPLGSQGKAELRFDSELTANSLSRLIRHLELMREILIEDQADI